MTRGERAPSPHFPGGVSSGLDSPRPLPPLPNWPLPIGTGKTMLSSARPRDLAKRLKFSFRSGGSSLVLPVAKMVGEGPGDAP